MLFVRIIRAENTDKIMMIFEVGRIKAKHSYLEKKKPMKTPGSIFKHKIYASSFISPANISISIEIGVPIRKKLMSAARVVLGGWF